MSQSPPTARRPLDTPATPSITSSVADKTSSTKKPSPPHSPPHKPSPRLEPASQKQHTKSAVSYNPFSSTSSRNQTINQAYAKGSLLHAIDNNLISQEDQQKILEHRRFLLGDRTAEGVVKGSVESVGSGKREAGERKWTAQECFDELAWVSNVGMEGDGKAASEGLVNESAMGERVWRETMERMRCKVCWEVNCCCE